jgi:hypothetical protein
MIKQKSEKRIWESPENGKDLPDAMVKRKLKKTNGDSHHYRYVSAHDLRGDRYRITGP